MPVETRLGQGIVRLSIVDEERFFPINSLVVNNTVILDRLAQFQRLLRALQIDDRLADAIIDWLDADDTPRPNGAESAYYASLTPPIPGVTFVGEAPVHNGMELGALGIQWMLEACEIRTPWSHRATHRPVPRGATAVAT